MRFSYRHSVLLIVLACSLPLYAHAQGPEDSAEAQPVPTPLNDTEQEAASDAEMVDTAARLDESMSLDSEENDVAAGAPAPASAPLPFRNSFFSWTNGATMNSFVQDGQLSYNPTYLMNFSLTPRWYFSPSTFLWVNQGLTLELTDSDFTASNREPQLTDTLVDLRHLIRWEGFVFQGQARVALPTSKMSQAAQRIAQVGVGVTATRPFPELANFVVSLTAGYRRWIALSNVPQTTSEYFCLTAGANGASQSCGQASGLSSASDIVVGGLSLSLTPIGALSLSASAFFIGLQGQPLAAAEIPINGGTVRLEDESPTHWRAFSSITLAIGYDVLPYLNLSMGVQNSPFIAPVLNPDGSVRSPFNADTYGFVTATLGIDALYTAIAGSDDDLTPEERQRRRQGLAGRSNQGVSSF